MKENKLNHKQAYEFNVAVLIEEIDKAYKEYLAKSENKRTTDIREDTFIFGIIAGMRMSTNAKKLIRKMNK